MRQIWIGLLHRSYLISQGVGHRRGGPRRPFAVELNRDIAPRERWSETTLSEDDKLEIVHFVGGGS